MKPSPNPASVFVLGFLVLALSTFAAYQHFQIKELTLTVSGMKAKSAGNAKALVDAEKSSKKLADENKAFIEESTALRDKLAAQTLPAVATTAPEASPTPVAPDKKNPFGNMMEKMMKNPKMLDAIAVQQMAVIKPMYADLVKQLRLNPEEAKQFYDLLAAQTAKTMQAGMKMLSGDKKAVDEFKSSQDEMQAFLGDRYSQYETYQKTIPDRAHLSQISAQMAARQLPLRPDQSNGLMQIMQQEKLNTAKFTAANTDPQNTTFNDKTVADTIDATEERNARILARAKTLLNPEQWNAFAEQQKQTLQMQKMGMEMVKGMMSGPSK